MRRNLIWLLVPVLLAVAALIRAPSIHEGAPGLEATYHVLLTTFALAESPVSQHHLLPTVTLGGAYDRFISWGVALPLASGHYVYTSFPVAGFLPPLAFFRLTHQDPSRLALFEFGVILQLLTVVALAVLLMRLLRQVGVTGGRARWATVAGLTVQILSSEALLDYGAIYWAQQFYQLTFALSLLCLAEVLRRDARGCRGWQVALHVLIFIGASTEWSGFVFAGGVFLVFAWRGIRAPQYRVPALTAGAVAVTAVAVTFAHYAVFAGARDVLLAFIQRAHSRSALRGSSGGYLEGQIASYGLFLVIAGAAGWLVWRRRRQPVSGMTPVVAAVLLAAVFPMLENLALLQHATEFSFDRLKLAVLLAILIALAAASIRQARFAWVAGVCLLVAAAQNVVTYQARLAPYRSWPGIERENALLIGAAGRIAEVPCAVIAGAGKIRAYDNLAFHRAVAENVTPQGFAALTASAQAKRCGAIYVEGTEAFTDLTRYRRLTVWRDGQLRWLVLRRR